MNDPSPTKSIDDAISRWERRLEGLRAVRELLADDPQFAKELAALVRSSNGTAGSPSRSETIANQSRTTFSLVVSYFKARDNKWATVEEISNATGVRKGTVSYVLYVKRNNGYFAKRDNPSGSNRKQWRLGRKGGDGS